MLLLRSSCKALESAVQSGNGSPRRSELLGDLSAVLKDAQTKLDALA